ncbi:MAG: baseplate protein J [Anaerolineaceae bacterium]|nr:baseplate protein J [Anaerolineaceae bacterium]
MPIPLRNLDDHTYTDLVAEAQALLPHLQPEWTNHNASDPGIMLIELFAWLSEMVLYRLNEGTNIQTEVFLELLNGPSWQREAGENINTAVRQSILALRDRYRAVTADDFVYLIQQKWPQTAAAQTLAQPDKGVIPTIDRIHCLPERLVTAEEILEVAPGHISLVVMPNSKNDNEQNRQLLEQLWAYLDARCLLSVQHHLLLPSYKSVSIEADLHLRADAPPGAVLAAAWQQLQAYFDPRQGGANGTGWPFGRSVYASEVYAVLRRIDLINYVEGVQLEDGAAAPDRVEVALLPHQLLQIDLNGLTAVDPLGGRFRWNFETEQAERLAKGT